MTESTFESAFLYSGGCELQSVNDVVCRRAILTGYVDPTQIMHHVIPSVSKTLDRITAFLPVLLHVIRYRSTCFTALGQEAFDDVALESPTLFFIVISICEWKQRWVSANNSLKRVSKPESNFCSSVQPIEEDRIQVIAFITTTSFSVCESTAAPLFQLFFVGFCNAITNRDQGVRCKQSVYT